MKNSYLFILLFKVFGSTATVAQTLTAVGCNPLAGEASNWFYTSYFSPGAGGSGQIWNFANLSGTQYNYNYVAASATPLGSSFPMATVAMYSTGTSGYEYYKTSATALQNYGSSVGLAAKPYSNPEDILRYPFSLNNFFTDTWSGSYVSNGKTFYRDGNKLVTADATGTLITPAGTFSNVIRLHVVTSYRDSAFANPGHIVNNYADDEYVGIRMEFIFRLLLVLVIRLTHQHLQVVDF